MNEKGIDQGPGGNGGAVTGFPSDLMGCFLMDRAELIAGWEILSEVCARPVPLRRALPNELFLNERNPVLALVTFPTEKDLRSEDKVNKPERQNVDFRGLPKVGAIIDKYRVEKLLGTGAFAAVYLVNHMLLNVPFALKLMLPQTIKTNPGFAEMLCEEASFAAKINHPNVVRVYDVTHSGALAYIVMEYVDGMTLAAKLARQHLSPREILRVGMDVCLGLQAGLEKGLIHRDIKPANLLVNSAGDTKIADLGLARFCPTASQAAVLGKGKKTSAQDVSCAGTPAYMAPEQITNPERADFRSDVYSLGVTLFHAATGRLPFGKSVFMDLVQQHMEEEPPTVQSILPDFPLRLSDLLLRMMAKVPEKRFASYGELFQEMKSNYESLAGAENDQDQKKSKRIFNALKKLFG